MSDWIDELALMLFDAKSLSWYVEAGAAIRVGEVSAAFRDALQQRTCQHCQHATEQLYSNYPMQFVVCQKGVTKPDHRGEIVGFHSGKFGCSLFTARPKTPE